MSKVECLEYLGVEGGETYYRGEFYDVPAKVLKDHGECFSKPTASKKDASKVSENK